MKMTNTKALLQGYDDILASLLKIEDGRPSKRLYKSRRSYTSPLNASGNLRKFVKTKHSEVRRVVAA